MFFFEIGTKILILLLLIAWPILFYLCSMWTSGPERGPKNYKIGFMISSLTIFKSFLICFLVLSVISLLISFFT